MLTRRKALKFLSEFWKFSSLCINGGEGYLKERVPRTRFSNIPEPSGAITENSFTKPHVFCHEVRKSFSECPSSNSLGGQIGGRSRAIHSSAEERKLNWKQCRSTENESVGMRGDGDWNLFAQIICQLLFICKLLFESNSEFHTRLISEVLNVVEFHIVENISSYTVISPL